VQPRFGPGVLGGSEAVMGEAAQGLAARGHEVEVLTTCAVDHYSWENELPEGTSEEQGLLVSRFPVVRHFSRGALRAQLAVQAGVMPDMDHQVSWLGFQFGSPGLFEMLLRHGARYEAVVFSPYMFWTTTVCLPLVADRAVVIPCLHDESYARLDVVRPVLESPALVWFLSEPEHRLAHRLGPVARRHSVTGAGVPVPAGYDPERFVRKYGLKRPFLLFAGRHEEGKGLPLLLELFSVQGCDAGFDLVCIGKGELPGEVPDGVINLGYLSDQDRNDAFAAASAYVQPSRMESFSRTTMEAWLAGTPVLALAGSDVVGWHCTRSGGGLIFDEPGFGRALRSLAESAVLAGQMAEAGRSYVIENYTWPVVLDRMEASLRAAL